MTMLVKSIVPAHGFGVNGNFITIRPDFGDVTPQKWTHSSQFTMQVRKTIHGWSLGNTNFYPNGSLNNIDLYKIGVNRAGNAHFEG